jgi:signal transduction histidine kinase
MRADDMPDIALQRPLQLLLVEDCDDDAELLLYRLRKAGMDFELSRVETEQAFRDALTAPVDLVISDFSLPQFSGPAALDILNELGLDIPLIIVSGAIGEESAVAAMKRGAIDYLLKDRLVRLPQAILQGVEGARMRSHLQSKQKNLAKALLHLERLSQQLVGAQEQERKNLARELHDELGQRLTVLNLTLHRLQPYLADDIALRTWREAEHEVSALIGQVRALSVSLRPPLLDYFGLEPSIRQLVERHFASTDIQYQLEYAGVPAKLSGPIEITAYRLVQEGLTNVIRHAQASRVVVEINGGESGDELEIVIRDNGKGFDAGKPGLGDAGMRSSGLLGMRERVELLGGRLQIASMPGQGTRIVASLPLKKKDYEAHQDFAGR